MEQWLSSSATDLGTGIAEGQIDPRDLVETYLAAIDAHPFADRIYARITPERARAEAAAASERAKTGFRRSPLDGVPISWKDLFDTAGTATESGSLFLKGRIPEQDAKLVEIATRAGLVCLGKTHQTELAFSGLGLNPVTASPPCINDHDAVSGGSSSGAATSVAFGLAALGMGSDTGGSVRIPSVWNNLVGLKTVHGRLSLQGVVPLCARFDTAGPLCRSVTDAAHMFAILDGSKPVDLTQASLTGVRFGILETQVFEGIEDAPLAAFDNAVSRLEAAGATVERFACDAVRAAADLGPTLFPAEAYAAWAHKLETEGDKMYPPVLKRFLQGKTIPASAFIQAWRELDCLRLDYRAAARAFDAVLVPSGVILPPKATDVAADIDLFTQRNLQALQNTRVGNLMGLGAITLPTGVPSCGIMVQGENEEHLLRLARAMELALA